MVYWCEPYVNSRCLSQGDLGIWGRGPGTFKQPRSPQSTDQGFASFRESSLERDVYRQSLAKKQQLWYNQVG